MMAADLDQAYTRWAHEELSDPTRPPHEKSIAQMLDHGSISFGRFAIESLSWEKRSVFNHNRRQEELEKFKAPGLVAQKKAYFEEYYRKIRALKALADDSHQVGDAMEGSNDDIHIQPADDDGCETSLMSTKSLTDVSTVSTENCSYEREKNAGSDSGNFNSEATSPFNSLGKTACVIELERNISDVSQITHLESDSLRPFVVPHKTNQVELECHSSNVSQITQIDSDSMVHFLDLSEASPNEIGAVHFETETNTDFHMNLEENHVLKHDICGKGLLDDENNSTISQINPYEPCDVSQLTNVDHKMSEPSVSYFTVEPKGTGDSYEQPTKIDTGPADTIMKKSTTASSISRDPSGTSRSLRGFNIQQESGSVTRNRMNQGPIINQPGLSRSRQVLRQHPESSSSAKNNLNQGPINGPGSSRSRQVLRQHQEANTSARNNLNQGLINHPGPSTSRQVFRQNQESSTSARNNLNQGANKQPGSSRTVQGLGNQKQSDTLARNNMNQGSIKWPGSSRSLRASSNQHGFGTSASNSMNQAPSVSNRAGSSRSFQGLGKRPSSSRTLQRLTNVPNKIDEEEGKVAGSSNRNKMPASDASSCTLPKEVHSKVTAPRPFSFATEKRAVAGNRINNTPHKRDRQDNTYNNNTTRLSATPFQTRSFSSSLNTSRKTGSDLGVKENRVENRHQEVPRKYLVLERQHTANGERRLKAPMHRSITLPASDTSHSNGKHSSEVGNNTRLGKKEEKHVKTPSSKSKQSFKDGGSLIKTPKSEIRKVVSSKPTPAAGDNKTPRQEVKRWR